MADVVFDRVSKVYSDGTRAVTDLSLELADGEFLVLVGPSGCGKTTALRMLAGLEEISEGEILIGGEVVNMLEPRDRDVAMVFQNYALYPHMSVFENIAFPLRSRNLSKTDVHERVQNAATLLGLDELLPRRPKTLSGGQRQRVAMGRAIVRDPKVFLMDEPLSNLDAKLRVQMRTEILKLQRQLGTTTVYVTHDQVEALTMGDRIAIMRKGVLQQLGPPQELYDHPANLFVATFIGSPSMNLLRVSVEREADGIVLVSGPQRLHLSHAVADAQPGLARYMDQELAVGIRPERLGNAADSDMQGWPRLQGTVSVIESLGSERLVHVALAGESVLADQVLEVVRDTDAALAQSLTQDADDHTVSVVARMDIETTLRPDDPCELVVEPRFLHFFDLQDGRSIRAL